MGKLSNILTTIILKVTNLTNKNPNLDFLLKKGLFNSKKIVIILFSNLYEIDRDCAF